MPTEKNSSVAQNLADAGKGKQKKSTSSTVCSPEMRRDLEEAFLSVDEDGSGAISATELHQLFSNFGIDVDFEEAQEMIDNLDEDGTGEIEFAEFLEIMMNAMEDEDEVIKESFALFDLNNDHFIEPDELKFVLQQLGENSISDKEMKEMISNADFDKDGRVGFDDFTQLWKNN